MLLRNNDPRNVEMVVVWHGGKRGRVGHTKGELLGDYATVEMYGGRGRVYTFGGKRKHVGATTHESEHGVS